MPQPTVGRLLNEAEDPGGSYEAVHVDLYVNVESRPTEHVIKITEDDESGEAFIIAEEHLYQAAGESGYTVTEEGDNTYRLTSKN